MEFTDKGLFPKDLTYNKPVEVVFGALSGTALVLASRGSESSEAVAWYHQFSDNWGTNTDWTINTDKGEMIENLALGSDFVAVATNRYLRIFSTAGVERRILCPKGYSKKRKLPFINFLKPHYHDGSKEQPFVCCT